MTRGGGGEERRPVDARPAMLPPVCFLRPVLDVEHPSVYLLRAPTTLRIHARYPQTNADAPVTVSLDGPPGLRVLQGSSRDSFRFVLTQHAARRGPVRVRVCGENGAELCVTLPPELVNWKPEVHRGPPVAYSRGTYWTAGGADYTLQAWRSGTWHPVPLRGKVTLFHTSAETGTDCHVGTGRCPANSVSLKKVDLRGVSAIRHRSATFKTLAAAGATSDDGDCLFGFLADTLYLMERAQARRPSCLGRVTRTLCTSFRLYGPTCFPPCLTAWALLAAGVHPLVVTEWEWWLHELCLQWNGPYLGPQLLGPYLDPMVDPRERREAETLLGFKHRMAHETKLADLHWRQWLRLARLRPTWSQALRSALQHYNRHVVQRRNQTTHEMKEAADANSSHPSELDSLPDPFPDPSPKQDAVKCSMRRRHIQEFIAVFRLCCHAAARHGPECAKANLATLLLVFRGLHATKVPGGLEDKDELQLRRELVKTAATEDDKLSGALQNRSAFNKLWLLQTYWRA